MLLFKPELKFNLIYNWMPPMPSGVSSLDTRWQYLWVGTVLEKKHVFLEPEWLRILRCVNFLYYKNYSRFSIGRFCYKNYADVGKRRPKIRILILSSAPIPRYGIKFLYWYIYASCVENPTFGYFLFLSPLGD